MRADAATALELILAHEGGKVDNPKDPGGRTNRGVTQKVYDAWRVARGLPKRDVWVSTLAEAMDIYEAQYLRPARYAELPAGLGYAVADFAVNSGVSRAVKTLQACLDVKADGVLGEVTLAKIRGVNDITGLIDRYCVARINFMRKLKTWGTFGKGWTRRVMGDTPGAQLGDHGVIDYAYEMATSGADLPLPLAMGARIGEEAGGKAEAADVKALATNEGKTLAVASAAGVGGVALAVNQAIEQLLPLSESPLLGDSIKVITAALGIVSAGLFLYTTIQNFRAKQANG